MMLGWRSTDSPSFIRRSIRKRRLAAFAEGRVCQGPSIRHFLVWRLPFRLARLTLRPPVLAEQHPLLDYDRHQEDCDE